MCLALVFHSKMLFKPLHVTVRYTRNLIFNSLAVLKFKLRKMGILESFYKCYFIIYISITGRALWPSGWNVCFSARRHGFDSICSQRDSS